MDSFFDKRKLELTYPCQWEYTLIGYSQELIVKAVSDTVRLAHTLAASHSSRTGRYCSMRLELTVPDEETRNAIHDALRKHEDIIMVL